MRIDKVEVGDQFITRDGAIVEVNIVVAEENRFYAVHQVLYRTLPYDMDGTCHALHGAMMHDIVAKIEDKSPKQCTTTVKEDDHGDLYIELPSNILKECGLSEEDELEWMDNLDGSYTIKKVIPETELVLVECIQQFKKQYVVEVPKGNREWALDTVVMNEGIDVNLEDLGETIFSHRVISENELVALCPYSLPRAEILETFVTKIK